MSHINSQNVFAMKHGDFSSKKQNQDISQNPDMFEDAFDLSDIAIPAFPEPLTERRGPNRPAIDMPPHQEMASPKHAPEKPAYGATQYAESLDPENTNPSYAEVKGTQCWAFTSANGGTGTTSLSIQTAVELARKLRPEKFKSGRQMDPRVCLIDLDFENGSCAHYLDVRPGLQLSDLQTPPERIDKALAEAFITRHESGIALLATPNILAGNEQVNPDTVLALLDILSEMYTYIILDLPSIWRPWTYAALAGADKIGFLVNMRIPAFHQARERLDQIEAHMPLRVKPEVILTKYERRKLRNTLSLKDAKYAMSAPINLTVCADPDSVREALDCGEPVSTVQPEARYVKDVQKIVNAWTQIEKAQKNKPKKSLRKRLQRAS